MRKKRNNDQCCDDSAKHHEHPPSRELLKISVVEAVPIKANPDQEKHQADEKDYWRRQLNIGYALNIVTAAATIAAGISLFYVSRNLVATERAAKSAEESTALTREAIHLGQRAYLAFRETSIEGIIGEGQKPRLSTKLKNIGSTPATKIESWLRVGVDITCPPNIPMREKKDFGSLGAGAEITTSLQVDTGLTKLQADNILLPPSNFERRFLCLHGMAQYRDIFGGLGEATLCYRYEPQSKTMVACDSGNDISWKTQDQTGK